MFDGVDDLAVAGLIYTTADWIRTVYDARADDVTHSAGISDAAEFWFAIDEYATSDDADCEFGYEVVAPASSLLYLGRIP